MRRIPPALVLYFLAPAIGELLSSSAPPVEFFNPFGLIILPALYGSGAILIREITLRWGKRWPSIIMLGFAYGIVEEGLMVKSFFDPGWPDLGLLGTYGRWGGVNWVWSLALSLYHATISIAIPILLVELAYPDRRDEPWVGWRGFTGLSILLTSVVVFGYLLLTPYRPPVIPYLGALVLVYLLYRLSKRLPYRWSDPGQPVRNAQLWLPTIGFFAVLLFFVFTYALPEAGVPVGLTLAALAGLGWGSSRMILWASDGGAWDDRGRFALAAGALALFILIAPFIENDPARPDDPTGMTFVALAAAALLVLLRWGIQRRAQRNNLKVTKNSSLRRGNSG